MIDNKTLNNGSNNTRVIKETQLRINGFLSSLPAGCIIIYFNGSIFTLDAAVKHIKGITLIFNEVVY